MLLLEKLSTVYTTEWLVIIGLKTDNLRYVCKRMNIFYEHEHIFVDISQVIGQKIWNMC